jgi:hypothetical protein
LNGLELIGDPQGVAINVGRECQSMNNCQKSKGDYIPQGSQPWLVDI